MKKMLNTIFVTTEGCAVNKDGENMVISLEGKEIGRVPLHMLDSILLFGSIYISPALIGACAKEAITLVIFERNGRFLARIEGPVHGNVLLRRAQYKTSEKSPTPIIKNILLGKISNQRAVLKRSLRDYGETYPSDAKSSLQNTCKQLETNLSLLCGETAPTESEILRGIEGESARLYFSVFDILIRTEDPALHFTGRSRRPPKDPVNALLSFLYTLLTHECRSAAESVGLDPAVGFLHQDRPGRPSLALDLMEELRPIFADRLALSLINRKQITAKDFIPQDGGGFLLEDKARKTVITAWQERKKEERVHPFIEEKAPLGLVPYLQAQLLARVLRGDLDAYPPWLWK